MKPSDPPSRVAALERRLARTQWMLASALALGLAGLGLRRDALEATEFRLVDASGELRATLGLDGDGNAGLVLRDRRGAVRGAFRVERAEQGRFARGDLAVRLSMYDRQERRRLELAHTEEHSHGDVESLRYFFPPEGQEEVAYVELGTTNRFVEHLAALTLRDGHGKTRAQLSAGEFGAFPALRLSRPRFPEGAPYADRPGMNEEASAHFGFGLTHAFPSLRLDGPGGTIAAGLRDATGPEVSVSDGNRERALRAGG